MSKKSRSKPRGPPDGFVPSRHVHSRPHEAVIKHGMLVLLGPSGIRQDVTVCVYRTSLEHFAVIFSGKRGPKPLGIVNLKKTITEREDSCCGFTLRQTGYDNALSAQFLCAEREEIDSWLAALTPVTQHVQTPRMPVVVEIEEF